ncbi:hypothetical protein ACWDTI_24645 [Gordonia sp. NPDC003424]
MAKVEERERRGVDMIDGLRDDVRRRAEVTPRLTAVRFADDVITYEALNDVVDSYEAVMAEQGMSQEAAFYAALVHCMPGLARLESSAERGRILNEVVNWLGRDRGTNRKHLRAVG